MSCPDSNAPIDISINNIAGKCDLKCAYNFKYPNSSCIATNRSEYISIAYDSISSSPVTYNQVAYNVQEIRIYTPSLHSFNGNKTVGEIVIIHNSNKGTNPLLVCVPLVQENSTSQGSSILTNIINTMTASAPSDGESTTVYMDDFTLDAFVPKKPFFSYTAIQPYQPCVGNVDLVVFAPNIADCYITDDSLSKLNTIILQNSYTIKTGPLLFINSKGPGSSAMSDEIFIDCKPVDKSSEQIKVTKTTGAGASSSSSTFDINTITESPLFQMFLTSLLFIFIILIFSLFIKAIGGSGPTTISKKT